MRTDATRTEVHTRLERLLAPYLWSGVQIVKPGGFPEEQVAVNIIARDAILSKRPQQYNAINFQSRGGAYREHKRLWNRCKTSHVNDFTSVWQGGKL